MAATWSPYLQRLEQHFACRDVAVGHREAREADDTDALTVPGRWGLVWGRLLVLGWLEVRCSGVRCGV
eukprot:317066-Chlamydomonas_euryale.AAC.10